MTGVQTCALPISRTELVTGRCVRGCTGGIQDWAGDKSAIRLRGPAEFDLGDPVLWRREGLPAYHLTNLADDLDLGITHVVRGADLAGSSRFHSWLNQQVGISINYAHHELASGADGQKLSKSQGQAALRKTPELVSHVRALAAAQLPQLRAQFNL